MAKNECLETLRTALTGQVGYDVVNENVAYYDTYISMQVRKGISEEEVLKSLGSPRLIAKTIIESEKYAGRAEGAGETEGEKKENEGGGFSRLRHKISQMPGWLMLILIVLLPILFMTVLSAVFSIVLSIVGPLIVPLFFLWCIVMLMKRFR